MDNIDYGFWNHKIEDARKNNESTATIHYFGFLHAKELENADLNNICRKLSIGTSYKVELKKMINLHKMIQRETK